jgi:WD40 repeat protein
MEMPMSKSRVVSVLGAGLVAIVTLVASVLNGCFRARVPVKEPVDTRHSLLFDVSSVPVLSLGFHSSGQLLASGNSSGTIALWDLTKGRMIVSTKICDTNIQSLHFLSGDKGLLAVSADRSVRLLTQSNLTTQWEFRDPQPSGCSGMALSRDERHGALFSVGGDIMIGDMKLRQIVGRLPGHEGATKAALFLRDGRLFTAGLDGAIRIWDYETQELIVEYEEVDKTIVSAAESPREDVVAVAGWARGGPIQLFQLEGMKKIATFDCGQVVNQLTFTPDGRMLLAACGEGYNRPGYLVGYDISTRTETLRIVAHSGAVKCISVSRDGKCLATAAENGEIKVWDCPLLWK